MQIRKESYRMSYSEGNDLSEQHMVSTTIPTYIRHYNQ
ncbi:hypothetical protein IEC_05820 [Bacillus toyonensis]|nr:hypothetical protein IEC_05820 [Bacillus toyonensis]EJV90485.1 hypothetical protein IGI_05327 [Bacillus toyonensis]